MTNSEELNLDPHDWAATRELAHRMLDTMLDYLQTLGERPVWTRPPAEVRAFFEAPLPQTPTVPEQIFADFEQYILPYNKGNVHPRFFSWVQGNGTVLGMLADMLASGMNPNVSIGDQAPLYVDYQVVNWCRQLMGFPATGGGMLVSGGSVANITALIVARNAFLDGRAKVEGVRSLPAQLVVYGSTETHNCIDKAVEVIGVGSRYLRKIAVGPDFRIDTAALRRQIAADRAQGLLPFCLVGNCGTVNTGAIDPLDELHDIAREEGLWFHIDGAFGALAKLVPEFENPLRVIERADSLAFDLHKWLYMNYEVGCVLIRDEEVHRGAFQQGASYLLQHERGLAAGPRSNTSLGLELSRGFKALKVWMSLREHGLDRYRQLIAQNIEQARYLGRRVAAETELELVTPVALNIVCYRYRFYGPGPKEQNDLNRELLMQLHESGIAAPSYTLLDGRYVIRVNITNHRTRRADLDALVEGSLRIGRGLVEALSAQRNS